MKLVRCLCALVLGVALVFTASPEGSGAGMSGIEFLGGEPFAGSRTAGVVVRVATQAQQTPQVAAVSAPVAAVDGMRTGALTVQSPLVLDAAGVRIYGEPHGDVTPRTPASVKDTVRHMLDNPRVHIRR